MGADVHRNASREAAQAIDCFLCRHTPLKYLTTNLEVVWIAV